MIDFVGARILENRNMGCNGNENAFSHGLFLGNIFFFALRVPRELFDTHEKLSYGYKVV